MKFENGGRIGNTSHILPCSYFSIQEVCLLGVFFVSSPYAQLIPQRATYRSSEELQSVEGALICRGIRRKQRLWKHQERPSHQEQEDIEEE